ncbi:hypothetical protein M426DRAFT_317831 [Hypoxylon sp. CI-4A]|nr:hypothetical protein M426DRAFT_317831 [Hypoxylon sp. CI-4A]
MTYTIVVQVRRRQDLTPTEFQTYYETRHVPLLKELLGDTFPITHTRNFVTRVPATDAPASSKDEASGKAPETKFLPVMHLNEPSVVDFDSLGFLVFEDYAAFQRFAERFASKEVAAKVEIDEANFADRAYTRIYALEAPNITRGNAAS